jgi:glycosyltransferase involved in cell wall biosynthesis/SAM-dependent methyltransferase
MDDELERKIGELFSAPPALHMDGGGSLVSWSIDAKMGALIREFVRPGHVTIETGAGVSTILFLLLGTVHRSITPDVREVGRILEYCHRQGIPTSNYHPLEGPSERVLPNLPPDLVVDFALIDGDHGFSGPSIDWYYITSHLATNGIVAVDDVQLWAPRTLADFLDEEDVWQQLLRTDRFAVYRMIAPREKVLGRWWGQQRFVARQSQVEEPAPPEPAAETATQNEVAVCEPRPTPRPAGSSKRWRPQITVAVPFPVHPPFGGGQLRVFSLYRQIARHFDVELVTLTESDGQSSDHEIAPGLREIRVAKSARHQEEEARLTTEVGGIPVGDIGLDRFVDHTPEYRRALARSIETATLVVASHPYALRVIVPALRGRPLVYEAQDVEYLLKKAVLADAGVTGAELVESVRELEAEACRASSVILCCSTQDRDDLCALYGVAPDRVVIAPNGVDTGAIPFTPSAERKRLKAEVGLGAGPIALFVGSWHQPNLDAAEALFEIAEAMPWVRFLLVGSQCLPLAGRPRPANAALLGVVDDEALNVLLAVADVALNPMLGGSGSNLKLATYLAAGVPVVTTPIGARGYDLIDGEHAVMCGVKDFPDRIARMVGDQRLAERLTSRGRDLVERHHDWTVIASGVVAALRAGRHLPAPGPDPLDTLLDRVSSNIDDLGAVDNRVLLRQVSTALTEARFTHPSEPGPATELRALADSVPFWFHSIDLGHEVVTRGVKSAEVLAAEARNLNLPDLRGKTVLDIGAWDGFFSFHAERLGAARVVSLDHFMWERDPAVTRYYQDCREQGVPPQAGYMRFPIPPEKLPGKRGYDIAARALGSRAEVIADDFMTMDLARLGQFDIVFYLGVLYHMQDPLAALRRLAAVARELVVIESEAVVVPGYEHLAICRFYEGSELNQDASNWWAPNQKALEGLCRAAGFARVETIVGPPATEPPTEPSTSPATEPPTSPTTSGPQSPVNYRIFAHAWK